MIRYFYVKPKILFVGINPHFGSYARGVPFSNNKSFWYLLSEAGVFVMHSPLRGEARVRIQELRMVKKAI